MKPIRVIGTGLFFATWGISCIAFTLIGLPLVWLFFFRSDNREILFRRFIGLFFRCFLKAAQWFGLISFEVLGLERFRSNVLVVSNHPSLVDVMFLLGWVPELVCIVKNGLFRNPLTAFTVPSAGYIDNDSEELLPLAIECLRSGQSLLIFPEGTRTEPGGSFQFRRGAANIALFASVPICPVTIFMNPIAWGKHQAWWNVVGDDTPHYKIEFHQTLDLSQFEGTRSRKARSVTKELEMFYGENAGSKAVYNS